MPAEIVQGDGLSALFLESLEGLERRHGQPVVRMALLVQLPLLVGR